jgi:hypothetical protein
MKCLFGDVNGTALAKNRTTFRPGHPAAFRWNSRPNWVRRATPPQRHGNQCSPTRPAWPPEGHFKIWEKQVYQIHLNWATPDGSQSPHLATKMPHQKVRKQVNQIDPNRVAPKEKQSGLLGHQNAIQNLSSTGVSDTPETGAPKTTPRKAKRWPNELHRSAGPARSNTFCVPRPPLGPQDRCHGRPSKLKETRGATEGKSYRKWNQLV